LSAGVLALALLTCAASAWLIAGHPDLDRVAYPPAVGAVEADYEVRAVGEPGVPLLVWRGLPYPSDVDASGRPKLDLNGAWELRLDPDGAGALRGWSRDEGAEGWEPCVVPATYDAVQAEHADRDGVVWFRRRFEAPATPGGSWARLCFRGVLLRSTVWLNGRELGSHEGGYTPFYLDVTDALRPGENLLVVRADDRLTPESLPPENRPGHRPGWAAYGGIVRDVYLETLPAAYLAKVALTPRLEPEAAFDLDLVVHARASAAHEVELALSEPGGEVVATRRLEGAGESGLAAHRVSLPVATPRLWSPATPQLYRLTCTLRQGDVVDRVEVTAGLRTVAAEGGRLLLNGAPIALDGIAKHEDDPRWGLTQPPEVLERDLALLDELGVNFVRVSHYPHARAAMEAMRDRGLLLCEEIPLYQAGMGWLGWAAWDGNPATFPADRFGLRQLHDPALLANARLQLIEMIERDRNNPAVVLWGIGNECYTLQEGSREVYRWLDDVVEAFDPSRPTTYAELTFGGTALDEHRQAGHEVDVVGLNMYFGWYFGTPQDAGVYLDGVAARFPERPILVTECGAGAALGRTEGDGVWDGEGVPGDKAYSEEYQAQLLEALYREAEARPQVVGFSPWVFADFRCPWFPRNPQPGYNMKGLLTSDRRRKQGFEALRRLYQER
jgi:beta-glucuronidase